MQLHHELFEQRVQFVRAERMIGARRKACGSGLNATRKLPRKRIAGEFCKWKGQGACPHISEGLCVPKI